MKSAVPIFVSEKIGLKIIAVITRLPDGSTERQMRESSHLRP